MDRTGCHTDATLVGVGDLWIPVPRAGCRRLHLPWAIGYCHVVAERKEAAFGPEADSHPPCWLVEGTLARFKPFPAIVNAAKQIHPSSLRDRMGDGVFTGGVAPPTPVCCFFDGFAIDRTGAGGWRLEAGGWRLEAGGWRRRPQMRLLLLPHRTTGLHPSAVIRAWGAVRLVIGAISGRVGDFTDAGMGGGTD